MKYHVTNHSCSSTTCFTCFCVFFPLTLLHLKGQLHKCHLAFICSGETLKMDNKNGNKQIFQHHQQSQGVSLVPALRFQMFFVSLSTDHIFSPAPRFDWMMHSHSSAVSELCREGHSGCSWRTCSAVRLEWRVQLSPVFLFRQQKHLGLNLKEACRADGHENHVFVK